MTDPIRRTVPSQSREAKPARREVWVGGMGGAGRTVVTTMAQKMTTGTCKPSARRMFHRMKTHLEPEGKRPAELVRYET